MVLIVVKSHKMDLVSTRIRLKIIAIMLSIIIFKKKVKFKGAVFSQALLMLVKHLPRGRFLFVFLGILALQLQHHREPEQLQHHQEPEQLQHHRELEPLLQELPELGRELQELGRELQGLGQELEHLEQE